MMGPVLRQKEGISPFLPLIVLKLLKTNNWKSPKILFGHISVVCDEEFSTKGLFRSWWRPVSLWDMSSVAFGHSKFSEIIPT